MSGKVLGTAVNLALQNHEAIRNVAAPAVNTATGVAQVIFRTMWKSTLVGLGLMVVWFAAFASTYILGGTNILGRPVTMALFGLFLFIGLPTIILIRESLKMSKTVAAKNEAMKEQARLDTEAREAEYARATAEWREQQERQAQVDPRFQPQPQTQPLPQLQH